MINVHLFIGWALHYVFREIVNKLEKESNNEDS